MSKINTTSRIVLVDSMQIGSIVGYPSNAIPDGYLECNGQAINRVEFAELFKRIGTTYGAGDGTSTFNLPDYRGRFLRHNDNGKGLDPSRVLGSVQADDYKSHVHTVTRDYSNQIVTNASYVGFGTFNTVSGTAAMAVASSGGTETRPVNITILWCMKVKNVGFDTSGLTLTPTTFASLGHTTHIGEASLLTQNGYKKFADGLIMQWGLISSMGASSVSMVTLPVAFQNYFLSASITTINSTDTQELKITSYGLTQILVKNMSGGTTQSGFYLCFGY